MLWVSHSFAQQNSITITANLDLKKDVLQIQQEILYYNTSDATLTDVYLLNWGNSFKNRKTPLTKRFIENYDKTLYFADSVDRGHTTIKNLTVDYEPTAFIELKKQSDILKIALNKKLHPKQSIRINITYTVKLPNAKFTKYGKTQNGYHLRFWHITPAVYHNGWQLNSNLDMDDYYMTPTNYAIKVKLPRGLTIESNLPVAKENDYFVLKDTSRTDVIMSILPFNYYSKIKTPEIEVVTDITSRGINSKLANNIIARELDFIKKYLGTYPHQKMMIDNATQSKNPIYGLNQLPSFLSPFTDVFEWDLTMFKAISRKYLENSLFVNKRTDYWLIDGLQIYLLIQYVKKYYPEVKLLGRVSKIWGIRSFNFSKLDFNDKYPFVYQFGARRFLDQSLTTRADSLSNFNRKIVNKYKAGLGLQYLRGYLGDSILHASIKEFYNNNRLQLTHSNQFANIIKSKTDKKLNWFFGDYVQTNKKIDYTIKKVTIQKDSVKVTIKNKRDMTAPVALYGVQDKKIVFKKWIPNIDSTQTVTIPKGNFDRISLNYENLYPEYNTLNNWKSLKKRLFNKPLQFRLLKDIEDPYYTQIYIQPEVRYNFYDGVTLVSKFHNRPIIARNLELSISPSYATKSNSLTGGFGITYSDFAKPESKVYRTIYGIGGIYQHYQRDLAYRSISPYVQIQFKRNTLRDVGNEALSFSLVSIDKEIADGQVASEEDKYTIFDIGYFYSKLDIITGFNYSFGLEVGDNFSKLKTNIRYRKLTGTDRRLEFRFYGGVFLHNKSQGDYFSFGLDRANDYLFRLNYLGRSEDSGIFSQQFIAAEGGFKSKLPVRFANQYLFSFNSSIGLWRWFEIYNDVAFLKNRGQQVYFAYENGFRLNFVPNILELYFPMYSNNGWEVNQHAYPRKIRFVLTANFSAIYNFIRRGFL